MTRNSEDLPTLDQVFHILYLTLVWIFLVVVLEGLLDGFMEGILLVFDPNHIIVVIIDALIIIPKWILNLVKLRGQLILIILHDCLCVSHGRISANLVQHSWP